jgi:translation initiation factor 5
MDANAQALAAASAKRAAEKDDKEEWSEDTSKEVQMKRRLEEMRAMGLIEDDSKQVDAAAEKMLQLALSTKEKDSPVWVLRRFILETPRSTSQILAELRRLELARNLNDAQRYRTLLEAVLDTQQSKTLIQQLQTHLPLLRKAASDKLQLSTLFGAFEELLGTVDADKCLPRVPLVLKALYDEDLFDEEFLICWYDSPPEASLTVSRPVAVELRKRAQPFIEWLKAAEADDDEDDEDDEEDDE